MNHQKGFVHIVVVILISVMAVGLVGTAWYYEGNKTTISIQTYPTKEECESKTGCQCDVLLCEYKCSKNFKEGWACNNSTINTNKTTTDTTSPATIESRDILVDFNKHGFLYLSCPDLVNKRSILYQHTGWFESDSGWTQPLTFIPFRCDPWTTGFDGTDIYFVNLDGGIGKYITKDNSIKNYDLPTSGKISSLIVINRTTLYVVSGECFRNQCSLLRYNTTEDKYEIIIENLTDKVEKKFVYGGFLLLEYESEEKIITTLYQGGDAGIGGAAIYTIDVAAQTLSLLDSASLNVCMAGPCDDADTNAENEKYDQIAERRYQTSFNACGDYIFENEGYEILVKKNDKSLSYTFRGLLIACLE